MRTRTTKKSSGALFVRCAKCGEMFQRLPGSTRIYCSLKCKNESKQPQKVVCNGV